VTVLPVRHNIAAEWLRCRAWILPALEDCRGAYTEDDILSGLLSRHYLLFAGHRAAAVTYVEEFPALKVFHMFLAGGELGELRAMEADVAAHAKQAGITRMEISGRRGWLRALPGYSELCTTMIKDL